MDRRGAIESLLFVAGDEGLHLEEITSLLEMTLVEAEEVLSMLRKDYDGNPRSGLTIIETRQRYQLATKPEYSELIRQYAISPFATRLSQAALETLAIVAYKQPITRMEIDAIRGVQSSGILQRLLIRGLVKEVGREETPGRPILYGTTDYFMNYFGLKDMEELPNAEVLFQLEEDELIDLFDQEDFFTDMENNEE
ncbi:SMC-Scp complex subunit ScpB [Jeotgalibaca caeni]|uniref:SMC-Scp complex subunit ScpB n=1 Tax=Jeotgalibaca caeni TaxID=3028623 RepID=UPI00237D7397|nr:SMC-Scp complex subunit ScpB [Jeotgalibaca caeni]MDE1549375.1 SMC-Scp complex subunit ScpB [Jeotgalibaca caeni]